MISAAVRTLLMGRATPPAWAAGMTFWDDFDRGDGPIGSAPSKHVWAQVAQNASGGGTRVTAVISGGGLIAADSGAASTASYSAVNLGRPITKMRARVSFTAGTDGGGATLIVTKTLHPNDINHIVQDGAIHVVFKNTDVTIGFYSGGTISYIAGFNYADMAKDGTEYELGFDLSGDTALFYFPGSSAASTKTDSRFSTYAGSYATFEHFWATGQCGQIFLRVAAA